MISQKNQIKYFTFQNLTQAGVKHCFSTRIGGVSTGPYTSLNLGYTTNDDKTNIDKNFELICNALGFDVNNITFTNQKHQTNIEIINTKPQKPFDNADALVTNKPGIVLATYYADCVPLLFFDPATKTIANAHAGWRGCAGNMAQVVVNTMQNHYGSNPKNILVGIGPSISVKHFQAEKDVVDIFKKQLPFSSNFIYNDDNEKNKYFVNLWQICKQSLLNAGLLPQNIEIAGLCTYANADLFFSHRRDGLPRGCMAALIAI